MKKLPLILASLLCICTVLHSQDVPTEMKRLGAVKKASIDSNGWKHIGVFTINIDQAALSNWSAGGETFLFGINSIINQSLHHRQGKYTIDAYFDMELGFVNAASFKTFRKTNDRLDMTAEFEHELGGKHLNYGVLVNFNTQLFAGHNYLLADHPKISNFMSPGKLIVCPGIDYKNINEKSYFSVFTSPITFRWVGKYDKDFYNVKKFGVDSAAKIYDEFGAYVSIHYNRQLSKTVQYVGRLDLFSNYKRHPENMDVLMNNLLTINVSKLFAASILLDIIYDEDIVKKTQVQEIFGFGFKISI